jgi:hypothetical protein
LNTPARPSIHPSIHPSIRPYYITTIDGGCADYAGALTCPFNLKIKRVTAIDGPNAVFAGAKNGKSEKGKEN